MIRLGRTVKDALVHRMQQPGTSGAFAVASRVASRAVARAQRAAQRTPVLAKFAGRLTPPVLAKERAGSGKSVVLGAGRRGPLGIIYPGADSSAIPGAPGQIIYGDDPVVINAGRDVVTVRVTNTADRPISVGSHYHFAEANPGLSFDREAAWGRRQNIMAGGMTRFDPGADVDVELVPFAGRRNIVGFRGEGGGRFRA